MVKLFLLICVFILTTAAVPFTYQVVDNAVSPNPHSKAVGDIDGDGQADLLIAGSTATGTLSWYEYPNWTKWVVSAAGSFSTDLEVADIDNDGDNDIVSSDWYANNRLQWHENPLPTGNPRTSTWGLHVISSPKAHDIEVADLDLDGDLDIVTREQSGTGKNYVIRRQETPTSWTTRTIIVASISGGEGLHLEDLDGDGKKDVIFGSRWFKTPSNIITDTFTEYVYSTAWTHIHCIVKAADINDDGRIDIILTPAETAAGSYRTSWFEAPVDPTSASWPERIVENSIETVTHSLGVADMDLDGSLDIITAEMHQGTNPDEVRLYLNNNEIGTSWTKEVIATTGSHNIKIVDVHDNGVPDIFGANWASTTVAELWINDTEPQTGIEEQTVLLNLTVVPNPFSRNLSIAFRLETEEFLSVKVYDVSGREVRNLEQGIFVPGNYVINWTEDALPNGVYYLNVSSKNNFFKTQKVVLIK